MYGLFFAPDYTHAKRYVSMLRNNNIWQDIKILLKLLVLEICEIFR